MDRRQFTAASAALLTAGIAGCSQSSGDETSTDNTTPTDGSMDGTATPTDGSMENNSTSTSNTQLQYEGDTLTLENAPEQEIRGNSDLGPGSDLEIALDSETASDPFVKRPETNVQDDGRFSATADMSNNDEGTEFAVEVIHDDETLATADGRLV